MKPRNPISQYIVEQKDFYENYSQVAMFGEKGSFRYWIYENNLYLPDF